MSPPRGEQMIAKWRGASATRSDGGVSCTGAGSATAAAGKAMAGRAGRVATRGDGGGGGGARGVPAASMLPRLLDWPSPPSTVIVAMSAVTRKALGEIVGMVSSATVAVLATSSAFAASSAVWKHVCRGATGALACKASRGVALPLEALPSTSPLPHRGALCARPFARHARELAVTAVAARAGSTAGMRGLSTLAPAARDSALCSRSAVSWEARAAAARARSGATRPPRGGSSDGGSMALAAAEAGGPEGRPSSEGTDAKWICPMEIRCERMVAPEAAATRAWFESCSPAVSTCAISDSELTERRALAAVVLRPRLVSPPLGPFPTNVPRLSAAAADSAARAGAEATEMIRSGVDAGVVPGAAAARRERCWLRGEAQQRSSGGGMGLLDDVASACPMGEAVLNALVRAVSAGGKGERPE